MQTAEIVIFSGLLSGILAFISSVTATIVLLRINKKQASLLAQLQDDRLKFDREMKEREIAASNELERYKNDLGKQKHQFETDLKRKEDFKAQQLSNLFLAASKSRADTQQILGRFRSMVEKSRTLEDNEFLTEFNKAIMAFNSFSETLQTLQHLVRRKDVFFMNRAKSSFLEILLGMRLEKSRREQDNFLVKVGAYQLKLNAMGSVFNAKYRRFLQPRAATSANP